MKLSTGRNLRYIAADIIIAGSIAGIVWGYQTHKELTKLDSQPSLIQYAVPPDSSQPNSKYALVSTITRLINTSYDTPLDVHNRKKDISELAIGGGVIAIGLATLLYRRPKGKLPHVLRDAEADIAKNHADAYQAHRKAVYASWEKRIGRK